MERLASLFLVSCLAFARAPLDDDEIECDRLDTSFSQPPHNPASNLKLYKRDPKLVLGKNARNTMATMSADRAHLMIHSAHPFANPSSLFPPVVSPCFLCEVKLTSE